MERIVKSIVELFIRNIDFTFLIKAVLLFILLINVTDSVFAQSGGWDSFGSNGASGYNDYGSGVIQLVNTNSAGCAAAAVHETSSTYDPSSGTAFNKCYQVYFGCPGNDDIGSDSKGDGMAFSFSKCAFNINNGLACGGGLGYMGACTKMITIEFDTWDSQSNSGFDGSYGGGTKGNHDEIAIQKDGDASDAGRITSVDAGNLEDGLEHTVCINYNPSTHILSVSIDGTTLLSYNFSGSPYDLPTYFGSGGLNQTWSSGKYGATNPATVSNGSGIAATIGGPLCPAGVVITSPSNGDTYTTCDGPVTITAAVTPPAGNTVSFVEFFVDGISIGTDNTLPYTISNNLSKGNRSITAIAHYSPSNTTSASSPVNITITQGVCITCPTADAGSNQDLCNQTSTNLIANAVTSPASGMWTLVSGPNVPTILSSGNSTSKVEGLIAGTYVFKWTVTKAGCTPSVSNVTIVNNVNPLLDAGGSQNLCDVTSLILDAKVNTPAVGIWTLVSGPNIPIITSPNDPTSEVTNVVNGSYVFRWTVSSGSCAPVFSDITITNHVKPLVTSAGSDQLSLCTDLTVLSADNPGTGTTGSWQIIEGNFDISDLSNPHATLTHIPVGTIKLAWVITSGNCDPARDTVVITRNPDISLASAGKDRNICVDTIQLDGSIISVGTGMWSSLDPTLSFENVHDPKTIVSGLHHGLNQVQWTVKGNCGVTSSDAMDITVSNSTLSVEAHVSQDTLCAGTPALISANITGSNTSSFIYTWASSDGSIKSVTNHPTISVVPGSDGWTTYLVSVIDSNGCFASTPGKDSIYAIRHQALLVPNLITPNGDNKNDCLNIRDIHDYQILPGSQFELFNRWGQAVYKNNYYKNGDFCGADLADGMYFYTINTSCDHRELKGWIEIISNEELNK